MKNLTLSFLRWFFIERPKEYVTIFLNLALFLANFFAIPYLLKTLWKPWAGFKIEHKNPIEKLTYHLVFRGVGIVVRLFLLVWGIVFVIFVPTFFLSFLLLHFLLGGFIFYWYGKLPFEIWAFLSLFLLFLFYFRPFWGYLSTKEKREEDWEKIKKEKELFSLLRTFWLRTDFGRFLRKRTKFHKKYLKEISELKEPVSFSATDLESLLEELLSLPSLFPFWERVNLRKGEAKYLWRWYLLEKELSRLRWYHRERLGILGSPIKDFVRSQTFWVFSFCEDLVSRAFKSKIYKLWGRDEIYLRLQRGLSQKGKVFIVGVPGTGKKTLVFKLIQDSYLGLLSQFPNLNHKDFALFKTSSLAPLTNKEREEVVFRILREAREQGIILVFEDLAYLLNSDLQKLLLDELSSPSLRFISFLSPSQKSKLSFEFPELFSLAELVTTTELDRESTIYVLEELALQLEKGKRRVLWEGIREAVLLTETVLPQIPSPKRAVDVLKDAFWRGVVDASQVRKVLEENTKIPLRELEEREKRALLNLENILHQRIVNQERAIEVIAESLRIARAGLKIKRGPMGSFLFLGPTGVGKTETAKALAEAYFGSEERMVRVDMSEFQKKESLDRLIGTELTEGRLSLALRQNPFTVVLLDEIEKAHPDILNLFLQVLDEGFFTDGKGRKVYFSNSIVIATSNAGYKIILEALKEKDYSWEKTKEKLVEYLLQEGIFRPEFLNRFDEIVVFEPLDKQELEKIARLMLSKLQKRLEERHIVLEITPELERVVARLGYDPRFGAREMRRVIRDRIESEISKAILAGTLKPGSRVKINPEDFSLEITPL